MNLLYLRGSESLSIPFGLKRERSRYKAEALLPPASFSALLPKVLGEPMGMQSLLTLAPQPTPEAHGIQSAFLLSGGGLGRLGCLHEGSILG